MQTLSKENLNAINLLSNLYCDINSMPTKGHCKTVTFGEVAAILIKVISGYSKAAKFCRRIPSTATIVTK